MMSKQQPGGRDQSVGTMADEANYHKVWTGRCQQLQPALLAQVRVIRAIL